MLGISVYLGNDPRHMEPLVAKAQSYQFQSIFTSLHIPEDDPAVYRERLKRLGMLAKQYNMLLFADVSSQSLAYLNMDQPTELVAWGVTGLRLDDGYNDQEIVEWSKQMKIGLNASTVNEDMLKRWICLGLNIQNVEAWHNFYPRPETGLDVRFFVARNQMFQQYGIATTAFIPGDHKLRGPLYAGLPTLEKHRKQAPHLACAELLFQYHVDHVLIGDISAKDCTLSLLASLAEKIVPLRCVMKNQDDENLRLLVEGTHTNRLDLARDVIRSQESRLYAQKNGMKIMPSSVISRTKGSVTIDNDLYNRYAGELQITKRSLPKDARVNVVAKVVDEDIPLLECIGPGQKFRIIVQSSVS
ncbi:DUF871 domain-containing protein [Anoxybacteroides rupiense]|uniref:DUF871 domain-containing protein n=1 Tax=Anoxybacteroides rupiense TaxID=311460 RepID=UPI003FA606CF